MRGPTPFWLESRRGYTAALEFSLPSSVTVHQVIHFCFLDEDERDFMGGRMWRVHIDTRWWNLGIALTPGCKFVGRWGIGEHWLNLIWKE